MSYDGRYFSLKSEAEAEYDEMASGTIRYISKSAHSKGEVKVIKVSEQDMVDWVIENPKEEWVRNRIEQLEQIEDENDQEDIGEHEEVPTLSQVMGRILLWILKAIWFILKWTILLPLTLVAIALFSGSGGSSSYSSYDEEAGRYNSSSSRTNNSKRKNSKNYKAPKQKAFKPKKMFSTTRYYTAGGGLNSQSVSRSHGDIKKLKTTITHNVQRNTHKVSQSRKFSGFTQTRTVTHKPGKVTKVSIRKRRKD